MDTRTPTEEQVAKIWRELLELDRLRTAGAATPAPVFEGEM